MQEEPQRLSFSLSVDYCTERYKSSLGLKTPMLRNSFRKRRWLRFSIVFGILTLLAMHFITDFQILDLEDGTDNKQSDTDEQYDAFAEAKWASDSVQQCSQDVRKKRIEELCEKRVKDGRNICGMHSLANILVDDKHKVLYCEVPKAACTSWKIFFAELLGNITDDIRPVIHHKVHRTEVYEQLGFKFLNTFSPEQQLYRIQHYYKFMTVRNPLARVVSAYENKLERQHVDSTWYQQHVGTYIVKNYRQNPSKESLQRGHDVTFDEMVRFVGNEKDKFFQRWDRHWSKQFYTCCPCMIKYDYISKIETLADDSRNIIDHILPGSDVKLPRTNVMNLAKETARVQKPFKTVTEESLQSLLTHYITDLNMFGYGIDKDRKIFCNSGGEGEDACC